ncbi:MAG: response regulator [Pseudomonadota bacterium]
MLHNAKERSFMNNSNKKIKRNILWTTSLFCFINLNMKHANARVSTTGLEAPFKQRSVSIVCETSCCHFSWWPRYNKNKIAVSSAISPHHAAVSSQAAERNDYVVVEGSKHSEIKDYEYDEDRYDHTGGLRHSSFDSTERSRRTSRSSDSNGITRIASGLAEVEISQAVLLSNIDSPSITRRTIRILFAEDSAMLIRVFKNHLEKIELPLGTKCLAEIHLSGGTALSCYDEMTARNELFEIVFTDINMEDSRAGIKLARALRERGYQGPIIALTSDPDKVLGKDRELFRDRQLGLENIQGKLRLEQLQMVLNRYAVNKVIPTEEFHVAPKIAFSSPKGAVDLESTYPEAVHRF